MTLMKIIIVAFAGVYIVHSIIPFYKWAVKFVKDRREGKPLEW